MQCIGSSEICSTSTVRLVSPFGKEQPNTGIVEVCGVDGSLKWNLVCADDQVPLITDDGVSHAVCKQKGFVGASKDKIYRKQYP